MCKHKPTKNKNEKNLVLFEMIVARGVYRREGGLFGMSPFPEKMLSKEL